jgi:hypothetical protein
MELAPENPEQSGENQSELEGIPSGARRLRRVPSVPDLKRPAHRLETSRCHPKKPERVPKHESRPAKKKKSNSMEKLSRATQGLLENILAASSTNAFL